MITDELLMAFADGELDDSARRSLEAALGREPQLRERLQVFLDTNHANLRQPFEHILSEPVPDALLAAVAAGMAARPGSGRGSTGTSFVGGDDLRPDRRLSRLTTALARAFRRNIWPAALLGAAASGAALAVIGMTLLQPAPLIVESDGIKLAAGPLHDALNTAAEGESRNWQDARGQGQITPMLAFRAEHDGKTHVCRQVEVVDASRHVEIDIACHDGNGRWVVRLQVDGGRKPASAAVAAGNDVRDIVDAAVDRMRVGEFLEQEAVAELIRNGWR
jgi:hypothetical protein